MHPIQHQQLGAFEVPDFGEAGRLGFVAAGGALTGYLAAGDATGALIGGLTHIGLYGVVSATGRSNALFWVLAAGGLAAAGYLFYTKRYKRRSS